MKRKLIKYLIIAVIVVVVVGTGGYFGYNKVFASKTTATTSQYRTVAAAKTNLTVNVQGTGSVFAGTSKDISASNVGTLKDLTLKVGDTVKTGDKLFASDSDEIRQTLEKAATNVDKQNVSVTNSKNNLNSQIVQAQLSVADAQNSLNAAVSQVNKMTSTAPVSGTVSVINNSNEEAIQSGKSVIVITDSQGKTVQVVANNNGTIKGLSVSVGTSVTSGQKLFTSDSDDLRQAVTKAQNNLDKQKAALSASQSSSTDTSGLTDAQSQYATAADQVSKMTVTSPIDGVVAAAANVNGDALQSGKTVLTIVDSSSIKVKVAVDEMDINKIIVGQKTQIKFDAVSDQTYEGAVESIAQTGTSSNNVTTYDVVVSVSNPTNIKVGMNANVTILIDSKDDALTVPTDALVDKDGSKYVMVASSTSDSSSNTTNISTTAKSGTASRASGTYSGGGQLVKVTTGLKNENFVEILDGLTEGEKVLVTLPKTTTSTSTTNKNSLGGSGFSGGTGGYSGAGRSN